MNETVKNTVDTVKDTEEHIGHGTGHSEGDGEEHSGHSEGH